MLCGPAAWNDPISSQRLTSYAQKLNARTWWSIAPLSGFQWQHDRQHVMSVIWIQLTGLHWCSPLNVGPALSATEVFLHLALSCNVWLKDDLLTSGANSRETSKAWHAVLLCLSSPLHTYVWSVFSLIVLLSLVYFGLLFPPHVAACFPSVHQCVQLGVCDLSPSSVGQE